MCMCMCMCVCMCACACVSVLPVLSLLGCVFVVVVSVSVSVHVCLLPYGCGADKNLLIHSCPSNATSTTKLSRHTHIQHTNTTHQHKQ
jgi:hypothetical protein